MESGPAEIDKELLCKALDTWKYVIEYRANWNANGNSQQIKEIVEGDVFIRLHQRGESFFLEYRLKGEMYPRMWKVKQRL